MVLIAQQSIICRGSWGRAAPPSGEREGRSRLAETSQAIENIHASHVSTHFQG